MQLRLAGVVAAIMTLNWVAMLGAHTLLRYLGTVLRIFAVVLGIN